MVPNQESEKDDNGSWHDKEDEDEKPNEKQKDMDKPKINEDWKTPQKGM